MTDYIYDTEGNSLVLEEQPERAVALHNRLVRGALASVYEFLLDTREDIVWDKHPVFDHDLVTAKNLEEDERSKKILYRENVEVPEGDYYLKPLELLVYRVSKKKQIVADDDFKARFEETEWHDFSVMAELSSRRPDTDISVTLMENSKAVKQEFGKTLKVPVKIGGRPEQAEKNYPLVMSAIKSGKTLRYQVTLGKNGKRYPRLMPLPEKKK